MFDPGSSHSIYTYRFTMYLPENDCFGDKVPDIERWVQEACYVLVSITGGATRLAPAKGMWLNKEEDVLIEETTHIVYTSFDPSVFENDFHLIRDFICEYGRQTGQQTVAVEIAGKMHFISDFETRKPLPANYQAMKMPLFAS